MRRQNGNLSAESVTGEDVSLALMRNTHHPRINRTNLIEDRVIGYSF